MERADSICLLGDSFFGLLGSFTYCGDEDSFGCFGENSLLFCFFGGFLLSCGSCNVDGGASTSSRSTDSLNLNGVALRLRAAVRLFFDAGGKFLSSNYLLGVFTTGLIYESKMEF